MLDLPGDMSTTAPVAHTDVTVAPNEPGALVLRQNAEFGVAFGPVPTAPVATGAVAHTTVTVAPNDPAALVLRQDAEFGVVGLAPRLRKFTVTLN